MTLQVDTGYLIRKFPVLLLSAELAGGGAGLFFEGDVQIFGVAKAGAAGDFDQREFGFFEQLFYTIEADAHDLFVW